MSKKKHWTKEEEAQFAAYVDSVDTSDIEHLIDPDHIPGTKTWRTHSKYFIDPELDALPLYTKEELAALPEPWTKRGEMLAHDQLVVEVVADCSLAAARIFITGELEEDYIGEPATRVLLSINDVYYENRAGTEPLFIETRGGTVRMARFDPNFVWRCLHPDTVVELVQEEIIRLGVNMSPWELDYFDFYQNMVAAIKANYGEGFAVVKKGSGIDGSYHGIYLSCLLLFGKPGYMGVPAAEHFAPKEAAAFMRNLELTPLNLAERENLERLRKDYGRLKALTNPELRFLLDLYGDAAKRG